MVRNQDQRKVPRLRRQTVKPTVSASRPIHDQEHRTRKTHLQAVNSLGRKRRAANQSTQVHQARRARHTSSTRRTRSVISGPRGLGSGSRAGTSHRVLEKGGNRRTFLGLRPSLPEAVWGLRLSRCVADDKVGVFFPHLLVAGKLHMGLLTIFLDGLSRLLSSNGQCMFIR